MTKPVPVNAEWSSQFDKPKRKIAQTIPKLALLNLISFAALGLSAPYINLYLKSIGFSGTQIGILISVGAFLELTLNPLTNAWADRNHKHRFLYRIQVLIITVAHIILGIFRLPLLLGGAFVGNAITVRANMEMLSQLTLTRLDQLHRPIFGKIRMWGSVGWAIATIASGALIGIGGYLLTFFISAIVRLTQLPISAVLPRQIVDDDQKHVLVPDEPMRYGIKVLMVSQFIFYVGLNAFISFIWIYFQEGLGVKTQHIGFYAAVFAITEIIPFLYVDKLIERWNVRTVTIIGMFAMSIEWVAYSLLPSAMWIIPVQLFRAMGFVMYTTAITIMISRVSHPARVATNRALIMVTMPAMAMLISSPFIGWLYDNFGARTMFSFAMVTGLIASSYILMNYRHLTIYSSEQA